MYLLNYIYFLILTYYEIKLLTSSGQIVKSPFDKESLLHSNGLEIFWCLLFSTGLLALSAPGGLDLMAIRLLVLEILCVTAILKSPYKVIWTLPLTLYLFYLIWLILGCFYSPAPFYGIRVILKYSYPFLIALCATTIVRNKEVYFKSAIWARKVAIISIIISFTPGLIYLFPGLFWYGTASAINYISMIVLSLALFYFSDEKKKNVLLSLLFIMPCFIWVFRTSIMGSLVAIMAFFFIKDTIKSIPVIFGIIILGVMAVFFIPSLHSKMFKDSDTNLEQFQQGHVSMNNVNTNARAAMWEYLEDKFYKEHELRGSGTGAVQHHFYNNYIFGGVRIGHSDFVQMKCDNGLVGLCIYSLMVLSIYIHCFKVYHSSSNETLRLCAIVAGASMAGVFVTLYSDNVVNYSMATLSMPFGFYGMMLGLKRAEETDDIYSYTPIQQS